MENELFFIALEEIRHAKAVIGNKHNSVPKSLFEDYQEADVRFNGYKSVHDYRNHLKGLYNKVKEYFKQCYPVVINESSYQEHYLAFAHCLFEIAETRRLIFRNEKEPHFDRIEVNRQYNLEARMEPLVKKKS